MMGLTPRERAAIIEASSAPDVKPGDEGAGPEECALFDHLEQQGRVVTVHCSTDAWEWEEWQPTDLGRLALRVCPVDEP